MKYLQKSRERNALVADKLSKILPKLTMLAGGKSKTEYSKEFAYVANYFTVLYEIAEKMLSCNILSLSREEGIRLNETIYGPSYKENYKGSLLDPAYAAKAAGPVMGRILSCMLRFIFNDLDEVYQGCYEKIVYMSELLVKLEETLASGGSVEDCDQIYRNTMKDSIKIFELNYFRKVSNLDYDFNRVICMESDLTDPAYIYRYGITIRENEELYARFIQKMSEEEVIQTAITIVEGMKRAFILKNTDIEHKKAIVVQYPVGFERVIKKVVSMFEEEGYLVVLYASTLSSNKQYRFDFKNSAASYMDEDYVDRFAKEMKEVFEENKEMIGQKIANLAVESFGEAPFSPEIKSEALQYDETTTPLYMKKMQTAQMIYCEYMDMEHEAFTIIAYPSPEIGERFEEIYAETVKINNMDYQKYAQIQQQMIDVLDTVEYVHILGGNGNKTDLTIHTFGQLEQPKSQSKYCNCLADLNIPVGEVFTSPVLKGTNGKLHVSQVYLNGLNFLNLELDFVDGMVVNYTCTNFDSEEENKKYIENSIMNHHKSLPMGEFAIGTNTYAYRVGKLYDIQAILPILISEKTGPHFAIGDTCYSYQEDAVMKNADGKEVVEKANEFTACKDEEKKYFQCHTDITIPYNELKLIAAVHEDGGETKIIENGRFVLPGTECLNDPLEGLQ